VAKPSPRAVQWVLGSLFAGVAVAFALRGHTWPFRSLPAGIENQKQPSVWQYIFGDRTTIGFVRLAVVFASLFAIASVVALVVAGRWMKGFGGLSVDEKDTLDDRIRTLEAQLKQAQADLEVELNHRFEAEDWADALLTRLDQAEVELDATREELHAARGDES
jgi:hypothetical protein